MTRDEFKILHSDLIRHVQCVENDLRVIYKIMKAENASENADSLERANLGRIIKELYEVDISDGVLDLSKKDYELMNEIREVRNYWCHQCYIDYVYIPDEEKREKAFQDLADRLIFDENRMFALSKTIEKKKIELLAK